MSLLQAGWPRRSTSSVSLERDGWLRRGWPWGGLRSRAWRSSEAAPWARRPAWPTTRTSAVAWVAAAGLAMGGLALTGMALIGGGPVGASASVADDQNQRGSVRGVCRRPSPHVGKGGGRHQGGKAVQTIIEWDRALSRTRACERCTATPWMRWWSCAARCPCRALMLFLGLVALLVAICRAVCVLCRSRLGVLRMTG